MKLMLAKLFMRLAGWQAVGSKPEFDQYVLIAAPHTSNWDLAFMQALAAIFGMEIHWMGKHTLFRFPMGWFMKLMGGLPIRRHLNQNVVDQSAELFKKHPKLILVVPAEGTRGGSEYWRSGFYYIAQKAEVPIVLGYMDYKTKQGGFGPAVVPSGNLAADMDVVRAFYADKTGRWPDKFTPPRLRGEANQTEDPDAS